MRGRSVLVGLGLLTLASPELAFAQAQEDPAVDEVIVTARRREEKLQEVPLAVTAFTAKTMERLGIDSITDIARRTPNFAIAGRGDIKFNRNSLRGISAGGASAGADPAVGFYIDDVYMAQGPGVNFDLYDIERVEVLRGPQGTLFGRNSIGGVVSITTRAPSDSFEASVQATYGNYGYLRLGGSVSGPLADGVQARLSYVSTARDGTSDDVVLGRDVDTIGAQSLRGVVNFDMGADTSLTVSADYRTVGDQSTMPLETLRYDEASLFVALLDGSGLDRNTNPYDRRVYSDQLNVENAEAWGVSARFRTELGGARLTSITSYRSHDYYNRVDTDRSALSIIYDGDPEEVSRFSSELQIAWDTGPFSWLAGVYYFRQDGANLSYIEVGSDLADAFGDPSIAGLKAGSSGDMLTTSRAVFGSGTWAVTDRFDMTLGARYIHDEKKIDYSQSDPLGLLGGTGAFVASDSWNKLTPSFNARYRFTPDAMTYLTVSNGFKSGGYNDALGDATTLSFNPESLWNYEIGFKSEWFGNRLTANVALFYMDWSDIQITVDDPSTPIFDPRILNAGAAHSQGIEVETAARPMEGLVLGANFSVLEAEYDEGTLPSGAPLRTIPNAPEYMGALNAQYSLPFRDFGTLTFSGEYLMRGQYFLTNDNIEDGRVDPFQLVNLRISLERDNWRLSLWGDNLTDEVYKTGVFDLSTTPPIGQRFISLGEPRTFGVELRADF
jgi:iron complex outermembrane receptor protein